MRTSILALTLATFTLAPQLGVANGNQLGWCIGVGNKHQSAGCGTPSTTATGVTPTTIPTANQLPPIGTGTGPTPTTTPAIITVTPTAPTVITGTSPVVNVYGFTSSFTGQGVQPIVVTPIPQTVLTGVSPVPQVQVLPTPSFTGYSPIITLTPNPTPTLTGFSPVYTINPIATPSFTGQGLPQIVVVPTPPTTVTGYSPVSASIIVQPNPGQTITGYGAVPTPVPQATPMRVPQAIPTPVPQAIPGKVPQLAPQQTVVSVTRPRPRPTNTVISTSGGGKITHSPTVTSPARGPGHVTATAGRQTAHATPRFADAKGGGDWNCVASGFGKRRTAADAEAGASGALRHVGAVDVLGRDLPALHPDHANCVISVRRRQGN